jgi:SUKH-3 immunity protein
MQSGKRFPARVEEVLKDSGWFEGRNIGASSALPADFEIFPAASRVLAEFGGLKGGQCGAGINVATSDFDLRPALAFGESDRLKDFEEELGVRLYPLGEAHRSHYFLVIDERGQVYEVFGDQIKLLGSDFDSAIANLITGRRLSTDADLP